MESKRGWRWGVAGAARLLAANPAVSCGGTMTPVMATAAGRLRRGESETTRHLARGTTRKFKKKLSGEFKKKLFIVCRCWKLSESMRRIMMLLPGRISSLNYLLTLVKFLEFPFKIY